MPRAHAIGELVSEIDAYLSRLDGLGAAGARDGIGKWAKGAIRPVSGQIAPACDHLDTALAAMQASGEARLARAITSAIPYLRWTLYDLYPREEIGEDFAGGHAFATIIGDGGFFGAEDFDLGLFVIGPHIFYRDHHHAAPELYVPLTGPHGWRFNPGDAFTWKAAHETVWNGPWQPHATMTGEVPFLGIYCWTRDVGLPAKVIVSPDWDEIEKTAALNPELR